MALRTSRSEGVEVKSGTKLLAFGSTAVTGGFVGLVGGG
jgi:hypothetical protein